MGTNLKGLALSTDTEPSPDESDAVAFELSVRLDRPFHEQKDYLLAEFEHAYLTRVLGECQMNISLASRVSGLSRKHLRTLMSKYGFRQPVMDADEDHQAAETIAPEGE